MIYKTVRRATLLAACTCAGVALLSGCSSASSSDATPSATAANRTPSTSVPVKATTSRAASTSSALGECTEPSILASLPAGLTMVKFQCEVASPTMWAAARVNPGTAVYFLQNTGGAWKVSTAKQICGKPPAGLPNEIKAFCPKA